MIIKQKYENNALELNDFEEDIIQEYIYEYNS
jgi:hypothetical protein